MEFYNLDKEILMNTENVVIPKGWTILSHGSSFNKWNNPAFGIPAQNLREIDRFTIYRTIDGGLSCFDEKNNHLPAVYAGQEEPFVLKVLVPSNKEIDSESVDQVLRFINIENLNSKFPIIPADTTLVKIAENITDKPDALSVIWCVPEQFLMILQDDLKSLKSRHKRNQVQEVINDAPIFDINRTFVSDEENSEEEHILEIDEKPDEYYVDLEEQQQTLLDEEIAAEEQLEEKRAKDKERARALDKKNFAEAEAEYQKNIDVSKGSESYFYSEPEQEVVPGSENTIYHDNEQGNDNQYIFIPQTSKGYDSDFSSNDVNTSSEAVYETSFAEHEAAFLSATERRNREYMYDDYEAYEKQKREEAARFEADLQEKALKRQQQSENYKSFGSHGIDFSGKDNHTAYKTSEGNSHHSVVSSQPVQTITSEELDKFESDFYASREKFRSYGSGDIPENVFREYKEASDRYFTTQRKLENGTIVLASADFGKNKGSNGSNGFNAPRVTVQNSTAGADAPDRRASTSLKEPPKSPIDNSPLNFSEDKFRAIRQWANNFGDSSVRAVGAIKNQIVHTATSEESGTASTIAKTAQGVREMSVIVDCVAGRSGKSEAAKIWSDYVATANGIKSHGVDKQVVKDFGKINIKNINEKLQESLPSFELKKLNKKYGDAANISVSDAIGTKNFKIDKVDVFSHGKLNVRIAEGKIGSLRNESTILKSQIKELQNKGASLSNVERNRLSDLINKKKDTDKKLNNLVGATRSRARTEQIYRQINSMSPKKVQKELKLLEKQFKGGAKFSKLQMSQLNALRERSAQFKMYNALSTHSGRAIRLASITARHIGKMLRDSNDETLANMAQFAGNVNSASRFFTNRYVRSALKWSRKTAMKPARLAGRFARKIDRRFGISNSVAKTVKKPINAAKSRLLHTKPVSKITSSRLMKSVKKNHGLKKSVKKGLKKSVSKKAKKKSAKKILSLFKKFSNNKVVKLGKKAVEKVSQWVVEFSTGIGEIKAIALGTIAGVVAVWLIIYSVTAVLMGISTSVVGNDNESEDGRIDLTSYVETLNKEQDKINKEIERYRQNTEAEGGKYKRVFVSYSGGTHSNNYKEIISMTAVYFQQEFSDNAAVDNYLISLFNVSNYITTEESEIYYCSGCEEREYYCYDKPDRYATTKRKNLYNSSDHSDEKNIGEKSSAQKGCVKSALYSCMIKGHGTYNSKGCSQHNNGKAMDSPGKCTNYIKSIVHDANDQTKTVYECQGHCSKQHYDYSCPGHTEKICKGHIDLYVDVTCLALDKLYSVDPNTTIGVDLGNYKQGELIGDFNVSYYCTCVECCGKTNGITASGTQLTPGRTIATDWNVIPEGTKVIINGHLYVAEDKGGAIKGNKIDIAVGSHEEALNLGRNIFKVYKAVETDENDNDKVQRHNVTYQKYAQEASATGLISSDNVLKIFGKAKSPEVKWVFDRFDSNHTESFLQYLQEYDEKHKNDKFTNAELNAFEYVKMSLNQLNKICQDRDIEGGNDVYSIIFNQLIPYDKNNPDVYVKTSNKEATDKLYFDGWNDDNKEWVKQILENMNAELYAGLDKIIGSSYMGSISLEGVVIQGSKIPIKYYCQHDFAHVTIAGYSDKNISSSGCGFTSMAIVVSSLTGQDVDPAMIVNKYGSRYYVYNLGASSALIPDVAKDYGLTCKQLNASDIQGVVDALNDGKLVVVGVGRGGIGFTGRGYYRGAGHFLVICGVTENGEFLLADPNQKQISVSGTPIDMQYFLDSGIKSFRVIGKN